MSAGWLFVGKSTADGTASLNYNHEIIWLHSTSIWHKLVDKNGWLLLGRVSLLSSGISFMRCLYIT